jgi:hypothetical protein
MWSTRLIISSRRAKRSGLCNWLCSRPKPRDLKSANIGSMPTALHCRGWSDSPASPRADVAAAHRHPARQLCDTASHLKSAPKKGGLLESYANSRRQHAGVRHLVRQTLLHLYTIFLFSNNFALIGTLFPTVELAVNLWYVDPFLVFSYFIRLLRRQSFPR